MLEHASLRMKVQWWYVQWRGRNSDTRTARHVRPVPWHHPKNLIPHLTLAFPQMTSPNDLYRLSVICWHGSTDGACISILHCPNIYRTSSSNFRLGVDSRRQVAHDCIVNLCSQADFATDAKLFNAAVKKQRRSLKWYLSMTWNSFIPRFRPRQCCSSCRVFVRLRRLVDYN